MIRYNSRSLIAYSGQVMLDIVSTASVPAQLTKLQTTGPKAGKRLEAPP